MAQAPLPAAHIKVGIYGPSGVGKTRLGALAYSKDPRKVCHIYSEAQARTIIDLWNPDAMAVGIGQYKEAQEAWEFLYRGFTTGKLHLPELGADPNNPGGPQKTIFRPTDEPFEVETVVVDSFTDIFRWLKAETTKQGFQRAQNKWKSSKGSLDGFDDAEITSMQDWGIITDKAIALLQAFRNLPCNLVVIFAEAEREEVGSIVIRPYLQGKDLNANVIGFFNAFGYAYRRNASAEETAAGKPAILREVAFLSDERLKTKPLDGLAATEPMDWRTWHAKFTAFRDDIHAKRQAKRAAATAPAEQPKPDATATPSEPAKVAPPATETQSTETLKESN